MLTRRMITRGVRRQNKARREFLREPCDGLIVFGNACNNVANARKFFVGLATALQTPESFSWNLQQCCKRQKVCRGTCNSVANAEKFFVGLATMLQTPKSFSWDLQRCCKRQKVFRETCNSVANARKFFAGLATLLQTLSIPEFPEFATNDQLFPLGRLYEAHDTGVDAERATEGDDFFCSLGV